MSEMTLTLIDSSGPVSGRVHGSVAERTLAALSADPDTVGELGRAYERYAVVPRNSHPFSVLKRGLDETPYDAGILLIDLSARLVVCESSYVNPSWDGRVTYHDGQQATKFLIPFAISSDWRILDERLNWRAVSKERRHERESLTTSDVRDVLYGKFGEFLLREVLQRWMPGERNGMSREAITELHAEWLMCRRDDLGGQSPREIFLARRDHIAIDVENQATRWSLLREAPPGVSRDSWAYRRGGMGVQEFVVYYDLVRGVLLECVRRLAGASRFPQRSDEHDPEFAAELDALGQYQQEWMHTKLEEYGQMTPAQVMDRERLRLPCIDTDPEGHLFDDCPICQMMRQGDFGPAFWFLDGSHMDEHFAFSIFETREEWMREVGLFDGISAELAQASRGGDPCDLETDPLPSEGVNAAGNMIEDDLLPPPADGIWQRSYVSARVFDPAADLATPTLQLMGVGMHLAELVADLREAAADGDLIERLLSAFGDVQKALIDELEWLLSANVHALCELLRGIAVNEARLAEKCDCLCHEFEQFLANAKRE